VVKESRVILEGLIFPECPRWHDGRIWFSDMLDDKVIAVDPRGKAETVATVPGFPGPGGLGFLPDGHLLIVSMTEQRLLRLDNGNLTEFADLSKIACGPLNDLVVDYQGRSYVGDWGFTVFPKKGEPTNPHMILVTPDGKARIVSDQVRFPNGAIVTPDNKTLIVADTNARNLAAFDITADGSLKNYRIWAELGKDCLPDGICLDAEGAVWVTFSGNDILRVKKGGEVTDRITLSKRPYACVLGGPERKSLYLTTGDPGMYADLKDKRSGRLEVVEVDVPGAGIP
jgi:sugar lactone lactonase YvrE